MDQFGWRAEELGVQAEDQAEFAFHVLTFTALRYMLLHFLSAMFGQQTHHEQLDSVQMGM